MFGSFSSTLDTLLTLQNAMEEASKSDYFGASTTSSGCFPPINIFEDGSDYIVIAEIPGAKKEDLDIEIKDDLLKVSGKRKINYQEGADFHRKERENYEFSRSVQLPFRADFDHIEANYQNGILAIKIKQAEEDKPKKVSIH